MFDSLAASLGSLESCLHGFRCLLLLSLDCFDNVVPPVRLDSQISDSFQPLLEVFPGLR